MNFVFLMIFIYIQGIFLLIFFTRQQTFVIRNFFDFHLKNIFKITWAFKVKR